MFEMMYEANFTYDSSMPVYENKPPAFPYTMDYKMPHDCMIPPCPEKAYPGKGSILYFIVVAKEPSMYYVIKIWGFLTLLPSPL